QCAGKLAIDRSLGKTAYEIADLVCGHGVLPPWNRAFIRSRDDMETKVEYLPDRKNCHLDSREAIRSGAGPKAIGADARTGSCRAPSRDGSACPRSPSRSR